MVEIIKTLKTIPDLQTFNANEERHSSDEFNHIPAKHASVDRWSFNYLPFEMPQDDN